MSNLDFTPEELAIIEQVRNEPEPSLKPSAYEHIRERLLAEVDTLAASEPQPSPNVQPIPLTTRIVAVIIVLGIVLVIIFLASRQEPAEVTPPQPSPDLTALPTALPVTPTLIATELVITPSQVIISTPVSAMTMTTQANSDSIVVIEGPVSAINDNGVTIFGTDIWIDQNNPILADIEVGDVLNISGQVSFQNNVMIVIAVNITFVEVIIIEADPVSTLPPDCKITKNGHIKCSNTNYEKGMRVK